MEWREVDETGHMSGLAAKFPPGYRVLVDASGNIGGIEPALGQFCRS